MPTRGLVCASHPLWTMVAAPLFQNHLPTVDEAVPFFSFDVPTKASDYAAVVIEFLYRLADAFMAASCP